MTDQRMPGEKGVWLLERARQLRPRIIRMLVTAYADMDAAIAAVNSGAIYKYVTKPWDPPQLERPSSTAWSSSWSRRERDQLLHEKMSVLRNMMIADRIVSLGLLAAGLSHHIRNSLVAVKTFLDLAPVKMAEEKIDRQGTAQPGFLEGISPERPVPDRENQRPAAGFVGRLGESGRSDLPTACRSRKPWPRPWTSLAGQFAARRIKIDNGIPDSLPPLNVDKPKFYRLFELLLKDELASLPAGSRIILTAELNQQGPKPEIVMRLSDNGPGLPQEALRLVFDPFVVRGDTPVRVRHPSHGVLFHRLSSRRAD